jgi:hypothetical protein
MLAKEIDVVRLRNGRVGTIVHEYTNPEIAYEIEYAGSNGDFDTILPDDIVEIIASYGK